MGVRILTMGVSGLRDAKGCHNPKNLSFFLCVLGDASGHCPDTGSDVTRCYATVDPKGLRLFSVDPLDEWIGKRFEKPFPWQLELCMLFHAFISRLR